MRTTTSSLEPVIDAHLAEQLEHHAEDMAAFRKVLLALAIEHSDDLTSTFLESERREMMAAAADAIPGYIRHLKGQIELAREIEKRLRLAAKRALPH